MPAWNTRDILTAYFAAPLVFVVVLGLISLTSYGRLELMLHSATYLMSLAYMVIPAILTWIFARVISTWRASNALGTVAFLMLYITTQTAVFIEIARALSTPKPDDPSFYQELVGALTTFDPVAQSATAAALIVIAIRSLHASLARNASRRHHGSGV
jgi:hypothetical protein